MAARFWVPLVVTGCVSGTGGNPRLTVGSTAGLLVGTVVNIATAPGGVTGVSGSMTVSAIVDATHFEVTGTFGGTYSSGGLIGGGNWTSTSAANWSLTTGGAPGQAAPVAGDNVTLDGASGGGTVTVAASINAGPNSLGAVACGAFTGTLDFSVNNPNLTVTGSAGFAISGTGTRTIRLGSGTFTLSSTATPWQAGTITGLTFDAGTSTLDFTNSSGLTINFGTLTYSTVKFEAIASPRNFVGISGSSTFGTISIMAPMTLELTSGTTQTLTNLSVSGASASTPVGLVSVSGTTAATLTITNAPALDSCAFRGITFTNAASATNSFDLGQNTNLTVTGPSGGVHIIGG